jgi:hypothetical protein
MPESIDVNIFGMTHVLVFSVSSAGDANPYPASAMIVDLIGPLGSVTDLSFTDTDRTSGYIQGTFQFTQASYHSDTSEYEVSWYCWIRPFVNKNSMKCTWIEIEQFCCCIRRFGLGTRCPVVQCC